MALKRGAPAKILRELRDRGAQTADDLAINLACTGPAVIDALVRFKRLGFVKVAYVITGAGFDALDDAERKSVIDKPKPRAVGVNEYPLATTAEQINELKRKAEEDRSFGFESASQRMRITDVSDR